MPTTPSPFIIAAEIACWLAGLVLLVRLLRGHLGPNRPALTPWKVTMEGFVMCFLLIIAGASLLPKAATYLDNDFLGPAAYDGEWWQVVVGAAFQLGMLGGALVGFFISYFSTRASRADTPPQPPLEPPTRRPILAGITTFAIILPLIMGIGFLWKTLMSRFGFSTDEQAMVELFRNASSPALLVALMILAVVVAPLTEEVVFRAFLFRFLRLHFPRWLALTVSSAIFALLHGNLVAFVPLFAVGLFFALAYERTGRLAVPVIAHALFNLHTILLVLAGVTA